MNEDGVVHVVDDDEGIRSSLHWLFASVGIEVRGYVRGEAFLEAYTSDRPACLLLDLRLPGMSGLDVLDRIAALDLPVPVILLSAHGDIATAMNALRRGAVDFVPKPGHEQQLLDCVQEAIAANARCLAYRSQRAAAAGMFDSLTRREQRVMGLVAAGSLNREIAAALGISERTVESHRLNATRKLPPAAGLDLPRLVMLAEDQAAGHCRSSMGNWCPRCRRATWPRDGDRR